MHLGDYFTRGRVPHEDKRITRVDFAGSVPKKRYCDAPVFANFVPIPTRHRNWAAHRFNRTCRFPQQIIPVEDFLNWEFVGRWSIHRQQQTRFQYPAQTTDYRLTLHLSEDVDAVMCIMRGLFTAEQCYPRSRLFG